MIDVETLNYLFTWTRCCINQHYTVADTVQCAGVINSAYERNVIDPHSHWVTRVY